MLTSSGVPMKTHDGGSAGHRGRAKVKKVLHEYKEGDLKSGSGHKVTDKDQAVAIAMSEAGLSKKRRKRG